MDPSGLAFQRPDWWKNFYKTSGAKDYGKKPENCKCGDCACLRKSLAQNALALAVRTIDRQFFDQPEPEHEAIMRELGRRIALATARIAKECGSSPATPSPTPVPWPLPTQPPPDNDFVRYVPPAVPAPALPPPPVVVPPNSVPIPKVTIAPWPWWARGGRPVSNAIDATAKVSRVVSCACFATARALGAPVPVPGPVPVP